MNFTDNNSEEIILKSGVTIRVSAFPNKLWRIMKEKSLEKFPDPEIPKKTIKTLGEDEEVDDLNNEDYILAKQEAEDLQSNFLGTAILELCVHIDLVDYEFEIKKLEKYTEKLPDDPIDRKVQFLTDFAFVNAADYEKVTWSALTQMMITEEEVNTKVKSFRSKMAQSSVNGSEASSTDDEQQLELQREIEGT